MYRKTSTLINSQVDIISISDKALSVIDKWKGDWDMDILQYPSGSRYAKLSITIDSRDWDHIFPSLDDVECKKLQKDLLRGTKYEGACSFFDIMSEGNGEGTPLTWTQFWESQMGDYNEVMYMMTIHESDNDWYWVSISTGKSMFVENVNISYKCDQLEGLESLLKFINHD
jgi:hypothetical protein